MNNKKVWALIKVRKAEFHQKISKDNCQRSIRVWGHQFKNKKKIIIFLLQSRNNLSNGVIRTLMKDEDGISLPNIIKLSEI
jgi:hypothetical protein